MLGGKGDMIGMLIHALVCSLLCVGVHEATREGMIAEGMSRFFTRHLGPFWSKPFTECLTCMASIYGFFFVVFLGLGNDAWPVSQCVIFIPVVAGINATYGNIFYRE